MSTRFKGFALLAILLCAIGVMPVFASPYALQNQQVQILQMLHLEIQVRLLVLHPQVQSP